MEVPAQVVDTLTQRALALLTDDVMTVVGLLLVAAVLAVLWTERKKDELVDGQGIDITADRKVRWQIRNYAFRTGTLCAFILLMLFLPPLADPAFPWWVGWIAKAVLAATLAPASGLSCHLVWLFLVRGLMPLGKLLWQAVLNKAATLAAGRAAKARVTDEGVGFKPDQVVGEDKPPPTEFIDRTQPKP